MPLLGDGTVARTLRQVVPASINGMNGLMCACVRKLNERRVGKGAMRRCTHKVEVVTIFVAAGNALKDRLLDAAQQLR